MIRSTGTIIQHCVAHRAKMVLHENVIDAAEADVAKQSAKGSAMAFRRNARFIASIGVRPGLGPPR